MKGLLAVLQQEHQFPHGFNRKGAQWCQALGSLDASYSAVDVVSFNCGISACGQDRMGETPHVSVSGLQNKFIKIAGDHI